MSGHGHGHSCGSEGQHEPAERGLEFGLYQRIDLEKLQCLNESRDGDGRQVQFRICCSSSSFPEAHRQEGRFKNSSGKIFKLQIPNKEASDHLSLFL
ncbi:hypothetical protein XENOCAPTIV_028565 [Xenoophorus captivus]|uniref:Uncharacterized protein n=1 Tax=Xenoophorus captivus TaxID=1517983 RepID=A0ABV0RDY9_9TELE